LEQLKKIICTLPQHGSLDKSNKISASDIECDTDLVKVFKDALRSPIQKTPLEGIELRDECDKLLKECAAFSVRLNKDAPDEMACDDFEKWLEALEKFARNNLSVKDYDSVLSRREAGGFSDSMSAKMSETQPNWRLERCREKMRIAFDNLYKIKNRIK